MAGPYKKRTTEMERRESSDPSFLRLPGELRNKIYELVFENGRDTINLAEAFLPLDNTFIKCEQAFRLEKVNAALPPSALLRCCQQIYNESKGIFAAACQRYWKKTFKITLSDMLPFSYFMAYVPFHMMHTVEVIAGTPTRMLAKACLVRLSGEGKFRAVEMESVDRGRDLERWEGCDIQSTDDLVRKLKWFLVDYTYAD